MCSDSKNNFRLLLCPCFVLTVIFILNVMVLPLEACQTTSCLSSAATVVVGCWERFVPSMSRNKNLFSLNLDVTLAGSQKSLKKSIRLLFVRSKWRDAPMWSNERSVLVAGVGLRCNGLQTEASVCLYVFVCIHSAILGRLADDTRKPLQKPQQTGLWGVWRRRVLPCGLAVQGGWLSSAGALAARSSCQWD